MSAEMSARLFRSAVRRCGERIKVEIDGVTYRSRAVIENAGKNFMRKYDDTERVRRELGGSTQRDKVAFLPYFAEFEESSGDIFVTWRGKRYIVLADSVMKLKDEPVYIWALLGEISRGEDHYYDEPLAT